MRCGARGAKPERAKRPGTAANSVNSRVFIVPAAPGCARLKNFRQANRTKCVWRGPILSDRPVHYLDWVNMETALTRFFFLAVACVSVVVMVSASVLAADPVQPTNPSLGLVVAIADAAPLASRTRAAARKARRASLSAPRPKRPPQPGTQVIPPLSRAATPEVAAPEIATKDMTTKEIGSPPPVAHSLPLDTDPIPPTSGDALAQPAAAQPPSPQPRAVSHGTDG